MLFLSDDLISDPYATDLGRIKASEDGSEHRVGLGKAKCKKMGNDDVGRLELMGVKDNVVLWLL